MKKQNNLSVLLGSIYAVTGQTLDEIIDDIEEFEEACVDNDEESDD